MIINKNEFPVMIQAYQPSATGELFIAEQLVNTQTEIDTFASMYAGYVIKARIVKADELTAERRVANSRRTIYRRGLPVWSIVLLILVVLLVVGFTTGWIQKHVDIPMIHSSAFILPVNSLIQS